MVKYIDNISQKKCLKTLNLDFLLLKSNSHGMTKMLERYWEICLAVDANTENDLCIDNKKNSLYFLQIHISRKLNYLLISKIINSFSKNSKLQYIIRELAGIQFQNTKLEHLLLNNSINNIILSRWLSFLYIEQFYQYIKGYTKYILKSKFFCDWHNIKIQRFNDFLVFGYKDLLLLKWYNYIIQIWQFYIKIIHKNEINHKFLKINNRSSGISYLHYEIKFNLRNKQNTKRSSYNFVQIEKKINRLVQQKYIDLIKHIIDYNKINVQKNLIHKLNIIMKYWDSYWKILVIKENLQILNKLFDKALSRWAIFRHVPKPIKWIKKRYWYEFEDGTYFCKF